MNTIVGIGANVCDTLITVPSYPKEDTKLRADTISQSGGGPCATGLVAAAKLGGKCAYIGTLTDDSAGEFLLNDLKKYGVSTEFVTVIPGYTSFSSFICLSKENASRTCLFHRGNIPYQKLNDNQKEAIKNAQIIMIDGNETDTALDGVKIARQYGTKVLYDAGGLYDGVENLMQYVDILIPSEEFALGYTHTDNPCEAAQILYEKYSPEVVVITQGKKGGIIYDGKNIEDYPAFLVDGVDSNGSGDVFHGAFAYAVASGYSYYDACVFSSAVSALKCTKLGARQSVPTLNETIKFLRERGINV